MLENINSFAFEGTSLVAYILINNGYMATDLAS